MPDQQKLCDGCHERPATIHQTMYIGDTTQTQDLCQTCWEKLATADDLDSHRRFEEAKCGYCGAPAVLVSTAFEIPGVMGEETHCWCEQCRSDLAEFAAKPENQLPDIDFEDEAALDSAHQQMLAIQQRREAFIRQRVRDRRQ